MIQTAERVVSGRFRAVSGALLAGVRLAREMLAREMLQSLSTHHGKIIGFHYRQHSERLATPARPRFRGADPVRIAGALQSAGIDRVEGRVSWTQPDVIEEARAVRQALETATTVAACRNERDIDAAARCGIAAVVCEPFAGKSPIEQHQLVYRALGDAMNGPIHALETYTPERRQARAAARASSSDPGAAVRAART